MDSDKSTTRPRPTRRRIPILARHAITLAAVFALALPLGFIVGTRVYRDHQLDKLSSPDTQTYNQGLSYVYDNAVTDQAVLDHALASLHTLEPRRAADVLLGLIEAHQFAGRPVPDAVFQGIAVVTSRLSAKEAIDLYSLLITEAMFGDDERLSRVLLENFQPPADDQAFMQTVSSLDRFFLWTRAQVRADDWVRWLTLLARSDTGATQAKAARLLGELPDLADDPRVRESLLHLSFSDAREVRIRTLKACAGYAAIAQDPTDYRQAIFTLGQDSDPEVARRVWLTVMHLPPGGGFAINWDDAEPTVAAAMLWAAAKTNPDTAVLVFDAFDSGLRSETAHAFFALPLEVGAAYTRNWQILEDTLTRPPQTQDDLLIAWRYLPNLHRVGGFDEILPIRGAFFERMFAELDPPEVRGGAYGRVVEAGVYYTRDGFEPDEWTEQDVTLLTAWLEGYEQRPAELSRHPFPIYSEALGGYREATPPPTPGDPDTAQAIDPVYHLPDPRPLFVSAGDRVEPVTPLADLPQNPYAASLWIAVTYADHGSDPPPRVRDELLACLRSYDPYLRQNAALYAGMAGLRPQLIDGVTGELRQNNPGLDFDRLHTLSDAELAEFGLERVDALSALLGAVGDGANSRSSRVESKLLRLALWMRGDLDASFTQEAEAMLFDPTLPTPTVLMCLLHMQRPIAMDYLFSGTLAGDLNLGQLMLDQRWWQVFRRFVDCSDLPLWLWSDPGAQALQIEAMQQWYAVNRWRMRDQGWWPEPIGE